TVCKGDEVGGRRHRLARILELPDDLEPVPLELIEKVAGQEKEVAFSLPDRKAPPAEHARSASFDRNRELAQRVIHRGGLTALAEKDYRGGVLWVLDRCPFCDNTDRTAHVEVRPDGRLCFACKHNRCREYHW